MQTCEEVDPLFFGDSIQFEKNMKNGKRNQKGDGDQRMGIIKTNCRGRQPQGALHIRPANEAAIGEKGQESEESW